MPLSPLRERAYEAALLAARPLLALAGRFEPKLARGLAGQRRSAAQLEAWAVRAREPGRPLLWLHAPSVGEAFMAQAIVAEVRQRRPDVQVVFTHFSPSAERVAERVGAEVAAYVPWESTAEAGRALDAVAPSVVAFTRTEIWPVLTREAEARGIGLAFVNAALAAGSSRLRAPTRYLLAPAYARLDAVGAVAEADAARLEGLGVRAERVRVTGDARFDQVWARVQALDRGSSLLARLRDPSHRVLVAGSTWPGDEERLVPALAAAASARWRLIVAPHEPGHAELAALEELLDAQGLAHGRLSRLEHAAGPLPTVVVIDRLGVLADAYAAADVAYVGGGFGRAGLHSVVEPAAFGIPVLFGPRHGNAREAAELADAGGGTIVRSTEDLARRLLELAADAAARRAVGDLAVAYVRSRLGGAAANADLLLELLETRPGPSLGR